MLPEKFEREIVIPYKRPKIPCQLRTYKCKNNNPKFKYVHSELWINVLFLAGKCKPLDNSFYHKNTSEGKNGHMEQFNKRIVGGCDHKKDYYRGK